MSSSLDDFKISGPKRFSSINWTSLDDQRLVLACLVKATYVIENDIQQKRDGTEAALAPAWWQHFNFERIEILRDAHDASIFGCIYEYKLPRHADSSAPRFIIAFRGTMLDREHFLRDFILDVSVLLGGLSKSSRVDVAVKSIIKHTSHCTPRNVWVGGHSLGASIATVACKYMAKNNIHLKTFLFNPPFPSIPDLSLNDNKLRERLHVCKATIKVAAVSVFKKDYCIKTHEEFLKLASWKPYLFVNSDDWISTSYLSYFEKRENIQGMITGRAGPMETLKGKIMAHIGQVDACTSLREICSDTVVGRLEMPHLLPSACLTRNLEKFDGMLLSHGIQQWCQQDMKLELTDHHYQPLII